VNLFLVVVGRTGSLSHLHHPYLDKALILFRSVVGAIVDGNTPLLIIKFKLDNMEILESEKTMGCVLFLLRPR